MLKTYGFSNLAVTLLVFAESALRCEPEGVAGLVTAALLFPTMFIIILGPALLNIMDMLSGGAASSLTIK